jgi:hypothetical protein
MFLERQAKLHTSKKKKLPPIPKKQPKAVLSKSVSQPIIEEESEGSVYRPRQFLLAEGSVYRPRQFLLAEGSVYRPRQFLLAEGSVYRPRQFLMAEGSVYRHRQFLLSIE